MSNMMNWTGKKGRDDSGSFDRRRWIIPLLAADPEAGSLNGERLTQRECGGSEKGDGTMPGAEVCSRCRRLQTAGTQQGHNGPFTGQVARDRNALQHPQRPASILVQGEWADPLDRDHAVGFLLHSYWRHTTFFQHGDVIHRVHGMRQEELESEQQCARQQGAAQGLDGSDGHGSGIGGKRTCTEQAVGRRLTVHWRMIIRPGRINACATRERAEHHAIGADHRSQ